MGGKRTGRGWAGNAPAGGGRETHRPGVGGKRTGRGWAGNAPAGVGGKRTGRGGSATEGKGATYSNHASPGPTHLQSGALVRGRGGMSARSTVPGAPGPK
ncbi:hypothetical protein GCM10010449_18950 [Streptomyces rectiviolaceus]|uniref:Uncharacterized protein n=1 Tax=Streptomyces rectiviolaceus TaxID=332591 RepID=A0ABP6MCZ3_9ACTN